MFLRSCFAASLGLGGLLFTDAAAAQDGLAGDAIPQGAQIAGPALAEPNCLLSLDNDPVTAIQQARANPAEILVPAGVEAEIAARQRVLLKRMSKGLSLIQMGQGDAAARDALRGARAIFAVSHQALTNGNAAVGVPAPAAPHVRDALAAIGTEWDAFEPILQRAIEDGAVAEMDVAGIIRSRGKMLSMLDMVIEVYAGPRP